MKKNLVVLVFTVVGLFTIVGQANASLYCSQVNGASIFGYNGSMYEYIGSISNSFGSDSIANSFGHYGSGFSSDSIWNSFGKWGNQYGSYSPFNNYSYKPPVIVDSSYYFLGYLTTNEYKYPSLNPYSALACAEASFSSPAYGHEGMQFESLDDLPSASPSISYTDYTSVCQAVYGTGSYWNVSSCDCYSGYSWDDDNTACILNIASCPENSTMSADESCYCDDGYISNDTNDGCEEQLVCNSGYVLVDNDCITHTKDCQNYYGENVYGTAGDADSNSLCYCSSGYTWNDSHTSCEEYVTEIADTEYESDTEDLLENTEISEAIVLNESLIESVLGYILLQIESLGEAWYVHPEDGVRYYMPDGDSAYTMMRHFSLGITDADLLQIPSADSSEEMLEVSSVCSTNTLANQVKGRILLQVEQHGEAWYVHPETCYMIYMEDGDAAYDIMRFLSLGITNWDLADIPAGTVSY